MKKRLSILLCLVLLLTGCGQKPEQGHSPTTAPDVIIQPPTQPGTSSMHAVITPLVTENYVAEDGTLLSYRRYPNFQLILGDSGVEAMISRDLQDRMENFLTNTADLQEMAQQDYASAQQWYPYFATVSYSPTRIDDQVLSFHITNRSQTNGLHSVYTSGAVTYDMNSGAVLILDDILVAGWSGQLLANKICASLSDIAENLDPDYETIISGRFSKGAGGNTAWYFSETGLCFYFDPYDIAPFFMGVVTAEIPYSQLSDLLKAEFVPADVKAESGKLTVEPYFEASEERFSFILPMATDSKGTSVLLYPTGTVSRLTVEVCSEDGTSAYTLFTADRIETGQALKIQSDFSDPNQKLRLNYYADGQPHTAYLILDAENDAFCIVYG